MSVKIIQNLKGRPRRTWKQNRQLLKHPDLVADTQVCDGNDDKGSSPDRLGYTPMGRVPGDAGKCMANGIYTDVQSATTISHMSSGNGDISDTFPKDKAGMQSSTTSPSSVLQVSPLNSLSMIAICEETRHREKDTSFGLPLPASMSANTAAKDNRDHTSFVPKKAQWCYSY